MAKEKAELLDELKIGKRSFNFIGKVKVNDDTFKEASSKEGSTWLGVNNQIGIETTAGNILYARVQGGYKLDNPTLFASKKDDFKSKLTIPYESRFNEALLKQVADFAFMNAGIEKDENGKRIYKRFLNAIDFSEYLKENLKDGTQVRIIGEVDYSPGKEDTTYTNYNIKGIYLNEAYIKDGEEVPAKAPSSLIHQSYLVDNSTLEKGWETEFKKNGQITLQLYVPQYLSKIKNAQGQFVEWKKITPIVQPVVFKSSALAKDDESAIKVIKKLFAVKSGVREVVLYVNVIDGYVETGKIEYEISPEMRDLIDMGLISEDEIAAQVTVRKNRVHELSFFKPSIKQNEDGTVLLEVFDKYEEKVLVLPSLDDEDEEDEDNEAYNSEAESFEEPEDDTPKGELDFMSMFN